MVILKLLGLYFDAFMTKWALKEIPPLHPDVPMIVRHQHHVLEQITRIWTKLDERLRKN